MQHQPCITYMSQMVTLVLVLSSIIIPNSLAGGISGTITLCSFLVGAIKLETFFLDLFLCIIVTKVTQISNGNITMTKALASELNLSKFSTIENTVVKIVKCSIEPSNVC